MRRSFEAIVNHFDSKNSRSASLRKRRLVPLGAGTELGMASLKARIEKAQNQESEHGSAVEEPCVPSLFLLKTVILTQGSAAGLNGNFSKWTFGKT